MLLMGAVRIAEAFNYLFFASLVLLGCYYLHCHAAMPCLLIHWLRTNKEYLRLYQI